MTEPTYGKLPLILLWAHVGMRNGLDEAVFTALKPVEAAVPAAGGFAASDIGVPLMRKAFDKNTGPLITMLHPEGEREGLAEWRKFSVGCRFKRRSAASPT